MRLRMKLAILYSLGALCLPLLTVADPAPIAPFSADDLSILFPAPAKAQDFANLISLSELTTPDPQGAPTPVPVWAVFKQFVEVATGPAGQVAGTQDRITFPAPLQKMDSWFVAGIRIDAGAPGLSAATKAQFGQDPQIRLIVQPVTKTPDGTPIVHDVAAHLIFTFRLPPNATTAAPGCFAAATPDLDAFKAIMLDVDALRSRLASGQLGTAAVTSNRPLGVHPGFTNPATAVNFRKELKSFLLRHISAQRLEAMAVASVPDPSPKPWIFLSMLNLPPANGGVIPVPSPTLDGALFAQELQSKGSPPRVAPVPSTNNLMPITCRNAASPPFANNPPVASRIGSSTSIVFGMPSPAPDAAQPILDLVADPDRSHFFNTDCVSCHTETTLTRTISPGLPISNIDPTAQADGAWDVRNFGWTSTESGQASKPSVTRRAANETDAVVRFVNASLVASVVH